MCSLIPQYQEHILEPAFLTFLREVTAHPNLASTSSFTPSYILVRTSLYIVRCQLGFTTYIEAASGRVNRPSHVKINLWDYKHYINTRDCSVLFHSDFRDSIYFNKGDEAFDNDHMNAKIIFRAFGPGLTQNYLAYPVDRIHIPTDA